MVEVPEGDRSERFHRIVGECYRSGLTQAQTVTVLGSWPSGVDKYGPRLDSEVARSWAKVAHDDAGAPVGGDRPAVSGKSEKTTAHGAGWQLNAIDGNVMVAKRMKYLWEDRIPVGAITLAPGEEGVGKSTVCMRIAADLTRGTLRGEFLGTPRHVIVVAPEDGLYDVALPRIQQAGADMEMVTFIPSKTLMVDEGLVEDALSLANEDLKLLADLAREKQTALIVFDSFVSMMPNKVDARSYKDVNVTLAPLKRFAEQNRVAILAPWHLNKSSGSDTALRMMDSRAFRTGPRSVLLMVAVPGKPDEGLIALDKVNARDLRSVPAIRYRIRSSAYQVEEVDEDTGEALLIDATCGVADFIGEEPGFGRDNARAMLDPDSDRNSTIQAWLRDFMMSHGESLASEVLSAAESAGFSRSAIYRANRALGVRSREEGIAGRPPKRRAWWSLPEPAS
jgi:archaellum biogenesis ATPase FlaH